MQLRPFTYKQTGNVAGSVRYSLNANQYCNISYSWNYNQADGKNQCVVTAEAVNTGAPEQDLICACNQTAGSDVCRNQRVENNVCTSGIEFYLSPLVLKSAVNFKVTLENIYYYDLKLSGSIGTYTSTLAKSIPASAYTIFTAKTDDVDDVLSVTYKFSEDSGRGCTYSFNWDTSNRQCIAKAVKSGSIHCNANVIHYDPASETCSYTFSVGGDAVK